MTSGVEFISSIIAVNVALLAGFIIGLYYPKIKAWEDKEKARKLAKKGLK